MVQAYCSMWASMFSSAGLLWGDETMFIIMPGHIFNPRQTSIQKTATRGRIYFVDRGLPHSLWLWAECHALEWQLPERAY